MFLLISFGYIHQNSLETPSNCSKDGLLEESYCTNKSTYRLH